MKVGFRKIFLRRVFPSNPSLNQIIARLTAIVMGDVNAVYTIECAHRRLLLAARPLHERSLLIRGLPFPPTKTIGDVYVDDLVTHSVLEFSNVYFGGSHASYDFLKTLTNVRQYALSRVLARLVRRRFGHTRIPS